MTGSLPQLSTIRQLELGITSAVFAALEAKGGGSTTIWLDMEYRFLHVLIFPQPQLILLKLQKFLYQA